MKKSRYLRIYDLHSWSGITLGLFVYIVSFTGCLALFDNELKTWEDPVKRLKVAEHPVQIMPKFSEWVEQKSENASVESLFFSYPTTYAPYYGASIGIKAEGSDKQERYFTRWNTKDGKEFASTKEDGLTEWLLDFHRDLMWPVKLGGRTVGRTIVGVAGVILLLSILTGIITHTKIIREFFTLRVKRSIHLKWQDLHKILGLWALPFYTMIAFTGAFLGVIAILSPIAAVLAFKGDTQALLAAINTPKVESSGVPTKMMSVDELRELRHPASNEHPYRLFIHNWGDETASYEVLYRSKNELSTSDKITYNAVTGDVLKDEPSNAVSAANRVTNSVSPLHYGTYGGIWLKILYLVLGIFLCVVTATGLMVWIERRLKSNKGQKQPEFYMRLGRFSNGIVMGFPIASIAIFYLDKLYIGAESSRLFYTGLCYFSMAVSTILFAMLRKKDYVTTRVLFFIISAGLLGLPVVNALTTQSDLWYGVTNNFVWAWVDVSFIITGVVVLLISAFIPKKRADEPRSKKSINALTNDVLV